MNSHHKLAVLLALVALPLGSAWAGDQISCNSSGSHVQSGSLNHSLDGRSVTTDSPQDRVLPQNQDSLRTGNSAPSRENLGSDNVLMSPTDGSPTIWDVPAVTSGQRNAAGVIGYSEAAPQRNLIDEDNTLLTPSDGSPSLADVQNTEQCVGSRDAS